MRRLALFAALLAVLVPPAFSTGTSETNGAQSTTPVELRISWWGTQNRHNAFIKITDMYTAKHANVKFAPVFTGWAEYWQKMAAEIAGGSPPDIMMMDYTYLAQYVDKSLLADLTKYKGGLLDVTGVSDGTLSGGTLDGKLYAVPMGQNADSAFLYNPQLLKDAGLQDPGPDWTWQDFANMGAQIHAKLGIYGSGVFSDIGYRVLNMYLRASGAHLYNAAGTGLGYTNDDLVATYLQILLSMQESGAIAPIDSWSQHNNPQTFLLNQKKTAFQPAPSSTISTAWASSEPGTTLKLAFFPGPNNKQAQYIKPAALWTASKTSKYMNDAIGFINLYTNDVDAQLTVNADLGVPISPKVQDAMIASGKLAPAVLAQFDFMKQLAGKSSPIDPAPPAKGSQIEALGITMVQSVLYKQASPKDAAAAFRTQAEGILSRQ
jgi:multiple sugar transport system substrate-binding protein